MDHVLAHKRVILGISGGIAAYKSLHLVRLLRQNGIEVQVVMSEHAKQFVSPCSFQALSGNTVWDDLWQHQDGDGMQHIHATRQADVLLIAPASANTIAKIAHGICDNLLTTLAAASSIPILLAPAMNQEMWNNPANQRNTKQLREDGRIILDPESGIQACGEEGMGRMLEPESILTALQQYWTPKTLDGKHVLLTGGSTFEAIDPVRGLSNRSSGRMAYALAQAAQHSGAKVTLICGSTALSPPKEIHTIPVESAQDMSEAVTRTLDHQHMDLFVSVAAVADYRVENPAMQKLKKGKENVLSLDLVQNPDILKHVASRKNPPFCIGFATETECLVEYAEQKRRAKKLPMLVANLAQDALGQSENTVNILDDFGVHPIPRMTKDELAYVILRHALHLLANRTT